MKKILLSATLTFFFSVSLFSQTQEVWGTAQWGGLNNGGVIFKMNSDGTNYQVVHNFLSPDGFTPQGNLMQASDGNLYGTCYNGGDYYSCTVFRYDPSSMTYIDVYDFNITDGDYPESGLVEGQGGILYGVTPYGGQGYNGVIYKYDMASEIYTNIFSFVSPTGGNPNMTPTFVGTNLLYGTAFTGGSVSHGVVYFYDIANDAYTDIHDFTGLDGMNPWGGLVLGPDNMLYGMTTNDGVNGSGTIYKIDPTNNSFEMVYRFSEALGQNPYGNLTLSSSGIFYGMTANGGVNDNGTIFKFDPSNNQHTLLHSFSGADGATPQADLYIGNNGKLFGTTLNGGWDGMGVSFAFDPSNSQINVLHNFQAATGSSPDCGFIVPTLPAGIDDEGMNASLAVYPSPAIDLISISTSFAHTGTTTFSILNIVGEEVMSFSEKSLTGNFSKQVSISKLVPGLYFVEMTNSIGKGIKKFVKQ